MNGIPMTTLHVGPEIVVPTSGQFSAVWDTSLSGQQSVNDCNLAINSAETAVSSNNGVEEEVTDQPEIDIIINNVVCTFHTRCHLNLKTIAMNGMNVIYRRENGMVSMKVRKPSVTASIWSSGKITTTGSTSEEEARIAGRKVARCLWQLGFKVRITRFRVVNVLGTCSFPFAIRINEFSRGYPRIASYEPELHPAVTYKLLSPKATIKIFSTGSITVIAPCVLNVQGAIEHIYPLVYEYRMEDPKALHPVVVMPILEEEDSFEHPEPSFIKASSSSLTRKKRSNNRAHRNKCKRPRHLEEDSDGENISDSEEEEESESETDPEDSDEN